MAIEFRCPECKKSFSVKDENSGRKVKCSCGVKIIVPARASEKKAAIQINASVNKSHSFDKQTSDFPSRSMTEFDNNQSSHDVDKGSFSILNFSPSQKKVILLTLMICSATILFPPFENESVVNFPTSGWFDWWIRSRHSSFILMPPSRAIRGYHNLRMANDWNINGVRLSTELGIVLSIGFIGFLAVGLIFREH
jgi:DNA-directed RNA polymerase subunit RPC12/RpoP